MTLAEVIARFNKVDYIWAYMDGRPFLNSSDGIKRDKIIKIHKDELSDITSVGFTYVWAWPGPDYWVARFDQFGIVWGFEESDIIDLTDTSKLYEIQDSLSVVDKSSRRFSGKMVTQKEISSYLDSGEGDIRPGDYFVSDSGRRFTILDVPNVPQNEYSIDRISGKHSLVVTEQ